MRRSAQRSLSGHEDVDDGESLSDSVWQPDAGQGREARVSQDAVTSPVVPSKGTGDVPGAEPGEGAAEELPEGYLETQIQPGVDAAGSEGEPPGPLASVLEESQQAPAAYKAAELPADSDETQDSQGDAAAVSLLVSLNVGGPS